MGRFACAKRARRRLEVIWFPIRSHWKLIICGFLRLLWSFEAFPSPHRIEVAPDNFHWVYVIQIYAYTQRLNALRFDWIPFKHMMLRLKRRVQCPFKLESQRKSLYQRLKFLCELKCFSRSLEWQFKRNFTRGRFYIKLKIVISFFMVGQPYFVE